MTFDRFDVKISSDKNVDQFKPNKPTRTLLARYTTRK